MKISSSFHLFFYIFFTVSKPLCGGCPWLGRVDRFVALVRDSVQESETRWLGGWVFAGAG
jgi:hypothetical protein